jgi:hypothetical protein
LGFWQKPSGTPSPGFSTRVDLWIDPSTKVFEMKVRVMDCSPTNAYKLKVKNFKSPQMASLHFDRFYQNLGREELE